VSELPAGWTLTNLAAVANWGSGGTPSRTHPEYFGGSIPWVKTGELGQREILETDESITELGLSESSAKLFPRGSVAVAMYGATIGKASILGLDAATNQACAVGTPVRGLTTKEYLFHFLCSQKDALIEAGKGGAQPNISQTIVKDWMIPLAPLNEQKRIADKLDAVLARVNACRERLDRVPAILKRFRQAVLAAATSGKLTEEWREDRRLDRECPTVELGSVARDFSYGSAAKSSKAGSVPVLRMGNIQDGRLDWTDLVYTSNPSEISRYRLASGDVLFNRTNSPELVGKTAVYRGEREAIYAGYLIRVRCADQLLPEYLNYCLNSPAGRDYCWRVKADGVSQSNINAKRLAQFEFDLPAIEEQTEIVRRVETLFAYADRLEARYATSRAPVERLTPALLAKAFRGKLVPQEAELARAEGREYEPAAVLLERIRAERGTARRPPPPPVRIENGRRVVRAARSARRPA
jgi:type I restriction enzyme, S subunit